MQGCHVQCVGDADGNAGKAITTTLDPWIELEGEDRLRNAQRSDGPPPSALHLRQKGTYFWVPSWPSSSSAFPIAVPS